MMENGNGIGNNNNNKITTHEKQKSQLRSLEAKLKHDVDADFFQEPNNFRTLPRVIDILGAQLLESDANSRDGGMGMNGNHNGGVTSGGGGVNLPSINDYKSHFDNLHKNNPAYSSLRKQQDAVEEAIEHLSLVHYKDLNASVVAVGQVSKRFGEAVGQVKGLRAQVQEIREQLANASVGHHHSSGNGADDGDDSDDNNNSSRVGMDSNNTTTNKNKNLNKSSISMSQATMVGGKSLRELWLKKLECEAVLSLLQKLEVIRETPGAFDALVHSHPCRIGAAVVLLSDAIRTMFKDDVTQIQALHKIMEQLMTRKQKAEEVVWETLQDVLYLRTGNYPLLNQGGSGNGHKMDGAGAMDTGSLNNPASLISVDMNSKSIGAASGDGTSGNASSKRRPVRMNFQPSQQPRKHLFVSTHNQRATVNDDSDNDSESSLTFFSDDFTNYSGSRKSSDQRSSTTQRNLAKGTLRKSSTTGTAYSVGHDPGAIFANFHNHEGQLLPRAMVESELDLEADELRCLETYSGSQNNAAYSSFSSDSTLILPRYTDPILGLRILVEALAKLGRLDDVERCISENIERELRRIAQLEQAKTLAKLEKRRSMDGFPSHHHRRNAAAPMGLDAAEEKLKAFKSHLKNLLTSFGSVMLRLNHLAQILRHRVASDPTIVCPSYSTPSSALHSVLVTADVTMQREIKSFLRACMNEDERLDSESAFKTMRMVTPSMMDGNVHSRGARPIQSATSSHANGSERGIFSLGIINDASLASSIREKYAQNLSLASRSSVMRMSAEEYVVQVLCPRTGVAPQIRHALSFRKSIAAWTKEIQDLKKNLAIGTGEDESSPQYNAVTEEVALTYLDKVIQETLLPMMHDAAVNGTVTALERPDAFDPITGVGIYNSSVKGKKLKVEMCAACQGLYTSTGPLFSALPKLPRGGEMYSPLVAVLEHAILTFLSRVKHRILELCDGKKAFQLLEDKASRQPLRLSSDMETHKPFSQLVSSYFSDGSHTLESDVDHAPNGRGNISPIAPSNTDTKSKNNIDIEGKSLGTSVASGFGEGTALQREQESFELEVSHMLELLNFTDPRYGGLFKLSTEEEFLRAVSLAHSLLKLSSQLERRLSPKKTTWGKSVTAPRTLRDSIKNIRMHGLRLAKFCRLEVLLQTVQRMSTIYQSSSLTAKDAVRLPTSVNSLGEYLASISDQMREYGGNKVTAYALSSLEQYVPLFLMETVRLVAIGDGFPKEFKISLNGVESLDRCCSVLYRDLKSATGFENSFWDDDIAADAFERAASYVALMELDMDELVSYWRNNRNEFTEDDYRVMFAMNGPRRRGSIERYISLKERLL